MTTTLRAAAVSRYLTTALRDTGIRRANRPHAPGGYTVTQTLPDTVTITYWGRLDTREALDTIAKALDGRYDVHHATADAWGGDRPATPELVVTPGTPLAPVPGTPATEEHARAHPSYAFSWDGTTPLTGSYATADNVVAAMTRVRTEEHGEATVDPGTGTITLHIGKDRQGKRYYIPSTPAQLKAHRAELERTAAHWKDQAQRASEEAQRLARALPTAANPDWLRTEIGVLTERAEGSLRGAEEARSTLAALPVPDDHAAPRPAAFHYPQEQREEWLDALERACADKPGHARYFADLSAFYSGRGPVTSTPPDEPAHDGIPGITWAVAAALSNDFFSIHTAAPAPVPGRFVTVGGYQREYLRLRDRHRSHGGGRKKFLAQVVREVQAEEDAADPLRAALRLDGPE